MTDLTSPVDAGVGTDVVSLLRDLIRFDTTNWGDGRSNGERHAAGWIADRLRAVGWEPQVLARADASDRANVVLRVPGTDRSLPGLLVHAHLDVVPAEPEQWSVDPFCGDVVDGVIWGRGALDMKDMCAMTLATLLHWGATGERPRRDVVVAFVADEEDRGDFGAVWLVHEHPDLFAGVEAAIGESGGGFRGLTAVDGRTVRLYPVAAAERGTMHLRLTATGISGHGSRPGDHNPVVHLLDAVHRLAHHPWPVHLSPSVRDYLAGTAAALDIAVDLGSDAGVEQAVADLGVHADVSRFTIRASSTPTMIAAGYKVNVIPGVATAAVDVRCPPGYQDTIVGELRRLIGDRVEYEFSSFETPVSAPVDGYWFGAIADTVRRADPEAVVVPFCMGGGTDAKAFSRLGIQCYGFAPLGEDPDGRIGQGVHGVDERIPIASVMWGHAVLQDFLSNA